MSSEVLGVGCAGIAVVYWIGALMSLNRGNRGLAALEFILCAAGIGLAIFNFMR